MAPSLQGALPELQAAFTRLQAIGASHGITFDVAAFGGVRSQADTIRILKYRDDDYAAALRRGNIESNETKAQFRPINAFGSSHHNYGAAFDVNIVSRPAGMSEEAAQKYLGQFAPSLGLRWGGLFKNPDGPHFELAISLEDAKQRAARLSGPVTLATDTKPTTDPFAFATGDALETMNVFDEFDAPPTYEDGVVLEDDAGPDASTMLLWAGLALAVLTFWGMHGRTR